MSQSAVEQSLARAMEQHQAGRLREAERLYQQVLGQDPRNLMALHNMGTLANQVGRNDLAVDFYQRAINLNPNWPEALSNLANALTACGKYAEAITAAWRAISLRPDMPEAFNNLGNALRLNKQYEDAILACRRAVALRSHFAEAYNNLGNAYRANSQFEAARAAYEKAIACNPKLAEAYNNLGNVLEDLGLTEQAVGAYEVAIGVRPNYISARCNLATIQKNQGDFDQAMSVFQDVLKTHPDLAEAHANLGMMLLSRGEYEQGWREHEWRLKCFDLPGHSHIFTQPTWDGSPLGGRTIVLHTEQGFGDAIQFARYIPLVIERGGNIILFCQPELSRLFHTIENCRIVTWGNTLPGHDVHCPLMSLPHIFQTTLNSIPNHVPYLGTEPALVQKWSEIVGAPPNFLRVGIAWAGNPHHRQDRIRSLSLEHLVPLATVSNVQFYSLQKGAAAQKLKSAPSGLNLIDLGSEFTDFADTAAAMSLLDLIITVDTSIAHLASALARPTWTLLQFISDWRWLQNRNDTPWYPTMRLFRQPSSGNWRSVIETVAENLSGWAERKNLPSTQS